MVYAAKQNCIFSVFVIFSEIKHKLKKVRKMRVKIHGNFVLEKLILTLRQNQHGQIPLIWMKMVNMISFLPY